jgi:phosphohistidine phosphatase SixA
MFQISPLCSYLFRKYKEIIIEFSNKLSLFNYYFLSPTKLLKNCFTAPCRGTQFVLFRNRSGLVLPSPRRSFSTLKGIPMRVRFLQFLPLAVALMAPAAAFADPSAIYVVRHAEKAAGGKDPELTAEGQARAQNIATILQKAGIAHVFSTPFARTRQTAQALAQRSNLAIETYDPRAPEALVGKVKTLDGAVLVVGHSNTVPELVRLFGGAPGADIPESEYDRLYQLIPAPGGMTTILLTSPPAGAK